jgi:hypothetical protein
MDAIVFATKIIKNINYNKTPPKIKALFKKFPSVRIAIVYNPDGIPNISN